MMKIERPEVVEDKHLSFLDMVQETGVTNMFGAAPYLVKHQDVSKRDSRTILSYWMESYDERHPIN
jgi:hypothetical protein